MNVRKAMWVGSLTAFAMLCSIPAYAQRGPEAAARTACYEAESIRFDADQHDSPNAPAELARAISIVDGALTRLGQSHTPAVEEVRAFCLGIRSGIRVQQGNPREAWDNAMSAWTSARPLSARRGQPRPADAVSSTAFVIAQARWSGANCADGLADNDLDDAEASTMQAMMRGSTPAMAQCLGAIRARAARVNRGVCVALTALPSEVPAFSPTAGGWHSIDSQTQVYVDGATVLISRVSGTSRRFVRCQRATEASAVVTGRWIQPESMLALVAEVSPCGEDVTAARCPSERVAYVFDASLALRGYFLLHRSSEDDAGPLALPLGELPGLNAFSADGTGVRIGTRTFTVRDGALVPNP